MIIINTLAYERYLFPAKTLIIRSRGFLCVVVRVPAAAFFLFFSLYKNRRSQLYLQSLLISHSVRMSNNAGDDKPSGAYNMADLGAALPAGAAGLSAEDRADLMNALNDKLQNLAGQVNSFLESLSPPVRQRVTELQELQTKHDELEAKFFEERAALEAKYQKFYEPLYAKRYEIVNGAKDVETKPEGTTPTEAENVDEKGVPEFWLTAMKTNEVLADQITERDELALKYLKDIKWCRIDNPKGFKIDFFFDTNPYFKNSVLTKTYHMIDEDEPILERAIGTEIEWHPGKNLTQKLMKKKPKRGSKNTKPVTKTEKCHSFFNFFDPPQVPEDDEELDEESAEQLQDLMEQDYDVGSTIRDKIIPHAVSWFTGEACQMDDLEAEEGDEDDEDDDDDDDEEEDEDEDQDDDEDEDDDDEEDEKEQKSGKRKPFVAKAKKAGVVQRSAAAGGDQPPECKQQ